MDFIINNVDNFLSIATQIIGVFAVIASMTPNEADNQILDDSYYLIYFYISIVDL